jgi:methyl-accepting chemotaxis protein
MKNASLKMKLLSITLGINVALGVLSVSLQHYSKVKSEQTVFDTIHALTGELSDKIAAQFYERYGDVQAFAMNATLQGNSRDEMVEYLNNMVALYGIYDLVMVVSKNGNLVAVNSKDLTGKEIPSNKLYVKNFKNETWFQSTLKGEFTEEKAKNLSGTLVEDAKIDPIVSEVYGEQRWGNGFSTQMKDKSGEVIGVITNRANFKWVATEIVGTFNTLAGLGMSDEHVTIFDKDATVMFQTDHKQFPHGTAATIKYNFDILGKENWVKAGSEVGKLLVTHSKEGAQKEYDPELKTYDVIGYAPISGEKFVDSLGWTVAIKADANQAMAAINKGLLESEKLFYIFFSLLTIGIAALSFWFSSKIGKTLQDIVDRLTLGAREVKTASEAGSHTSIELSEGSTEQAAAIQETAASIDEVAAMVKKNSENAANSKETSVEGTRFAEESKSAMNQMVNAIAEIRSSNEEIMSQVNEGNQKISEIVTVISEIENKTKVINDIVFQTKLLSFNASVEAARAGEHGKGFAVVAEEVGNLAQMSGNAAKEISTMLAASILKVEGIVEETRTSVERLIQTGKLRVDAGTAIASQCSESLDKILSSVSKIDEMVGEISVASAEQSTGAFEIQKAINQLDSVTQKNTALAEEASNSARTLNQEAQEITKIVDDLNIIITGKKAQASPSSGERNSSSSHERKKESPSRKQASRSEDREEPSGRVLSFSKKAKVEEVKKQTSGHTEIPSEDDQRFKEV